MTYAWNSSGYDGGGRVNACAIDPTTRGNVAVAGDVWGIRLSNTSGDVWEPKMQGANGIGAMYGRAVEYSVKHHGRTYWGIGTIKSSGGYFGMQDPANRQLVRLNSTWGFGSTFAGGGGFFPRAVGNRIVVDYDTGTGTEYVYGQAEAGIFRAVDTGSGLTAFTGFSGTTPNNGLGKSMVLAPDGSLYAIDWGVRTSDTVATGQSMWHITNPRGTPTINKLTPPSGAGLMNELRVISGTVWLLCTTGLFRLVNGAWVLVSTSGLLASGIVLSSMGGVGQTLYCATGEHPVGSGKACAKSTNGGSSWTWVTTPTSSSTVVQGTTRTWWLTNYDSSRGLLADHFGTNEMRVDPNDVNYVILGGSSGAYTTRDGGLSWHPSVNGMMGTEVSNVAVGPAVAEGWNNDTDWGTIHTLNHYATVAQVSGSNTAHTYSTASLNRSVLSTIDGVSHAYSVTWTGSFWDVTRDGTSIADAYSKGAIVNPSDLQVASDDTIYVAQFGGGVLVGNPRTVVVVAPTTGVPTLDTANPVVGSAVHVLVNDPTWDGTHPLTYTYQWQSDGTAAELFPDEALYPSETLFPA